MSTSTTTLKSRERRLSPNTLLGYLMFAVLPVALAGVGAGTWATATKASTPAATTNMHASTDAKSTLQTVSSDAKLNPSAQSAASWTPRDPTLPPAEATTVHNVTLEIMEKNIEVAPGVTQPCPLSRAGGQHRDADQGGGGEFGSRGRRPVGPVPAVIDTSRSPGLTSCQAFSPPAFS
jgi:hypothetical protein